MEYLNATGVRALAGVVGAVLLCLGVAHADDAVSSASRRKDVTAMSSPPRYSDSGCDVTPLSSERVAELAKKLSPEAYRVTQKSGTEPAFCGNLVDNKTEGTYCCVVCGLPLFSSGAKFHSGTGWPSFFQAFDPKHVSQQSDASHGMVRDEINCARCSAHLGHVFDDGPKPTGLRYCLNSAALVFHAQGSELPPESRPVATETAYFAGGCFWGVEHMFSQAPGVLDAASGYMNGSTEKPTYKEVCSHRSGHAEAVRVVFDPARISYQQLLEGFFQMHDPTQLDRQGPDEGDQYRSAVFTTNEAQATAARSFVTDLSKSGAFPQPIVTVIQPAQRFWPAEDHHQDYVQRTGRACHNGRPWWLRAVASH